MQAQIDGWNKVSGLAFKVTIAGIMPNAEGLQARMRTLKYVTSVRLLIPMLMQF
jgi:hypothetical protein